jgi:hypothetical protein
MNKKSIIGASVLAVSLVLAAAGGASAGHFGGSCGESLNAVEQAIDDAVFMGKRADTNESNLLAKLEAANAKIGQEKPTDAIDKLLDISDKATAWADAPKAKLEEATGINGAVADAIACVGTL